MPRAIMPSSYNSVPRGVQVQYLPLPDPAIYQTPMYPQAPIYPGEEQVAQGGAGQAAGTIGELAGLGTGGYLASQIGGAEAAAGATGAGELLYTPIAGGALEGSAATGTAGQTGLLGLGGQTAAGLSPYVAGAAVLAPLAIGGLYSKYGPQPKPNRKYSDRKGEVIGSAATSRTLSRHIPGWDNFSPEAKQRILDKAAGDKSLLLLGHADKDGNTKKDLGATFNYARQLSRGGLYEDGQLGGIGGGYSALPTRKQVGLSLTGPQTKERALEFLDTIDAEKMRTAFERYANEDSKEHLVKVGDKIINRPGIIKRPSLFSRGSSFADKG